MDQESLPDAWHYEQLVRALRWVAADPDAAMAAVDPRTVVADEIALGLGDVVATGRVTALVDESVLAAILEIHGEFDDASRRARPDFWTEGALRADPTWALQRHRARVVLGMLGEQRADPDLRGHV